MNSAVAYIETSCSSESGYASHQYARSLEEFGAPRQLPRCGGWLLMSQITGSHLFDGAGCYPLFCCNDWHAVHEDINGLAKELVSVRLVTDPFAEFGVEDLKVTFADRCHEFKQHFVRDLSQPLETAIAPHHLRNVRKALEQLTVRQSTADPTLLSEWQPLYDTLIRRHQINGIARFSPTAFDVQAKVPGFVSFSAFDSDDTCGMTWWYIRRNVAYYHLGAYSELGYTLCASYALFWTALQYFAGLGLRYASLGAGAGLKSAESGLARFKRGWATETRPTYFCGRILQRQAYAELARRDAAPTEFFPAYRAA
jgi:hypothetical protein